jgi:NADH:ubiquinone oxidoreductase subunit 3 (subunit A)
MLTGESQFHISTPLGIEPGSLMMGSKQEVHRISETWYECSEIAGSSNRLTFENGYYAKLDVQDNIFLMAFYLTVLRFFKYFILVKDPLRLAKFNNLVIGFANCVILYFNVDKNVSTYCKHLL